MTADGKQHQVLDVLRAAACDYGYHVWGVCDYIDHDPTDPDDLLELVEGVTGNPGGVGCYSNTDLREAVAVWAGMADGERRAWATSIADNMRAKVAAGLEAHGRREV